MQAIKKKIVEKAFAGARMFHRLGLAQTGPGQFLRATTKKLLFQKSSELSTPHLTLERDGISIAVPYHLAHRYVFKDFEPQSRKVFESCLQPGMTMIDVGANIGYHTVYGARLVGPDQGKVYAFEPGDDNLAYLKKNVHHNKLSNVEIVPCAAGAARRVRNFYLRKSSNLHSFYADAEAKNIKAIKIQEVPLDEIVKERVDFVKIDVEGAEMEVLKGMKRILQSNPDIRLLIEWVPFRAKSSDPFTELPEFLKQQGFRLIVVNDHEKTSRNLDEVLEGLRANPPEHSWYANLYAQRAN